MQVSNLLELIKALSCGTKLHIGVLFFGNYGNEKLILPMEHIIHDSPICQRFKSTAKGYRRCFHCRNAAVRKGFSKKTPFGGICLNGIYEYTHPIVENDAVIGMIYIGNVMLSDNAVLKSHMLEHSIGDSFLSTLEKKITESDCERMANVIESYIRMLIETCPKNETCISPLVGNLKNYLLANLEYRFNVETLSGIFHYNPKYLGRLFKKEVGLSLTEYVNLNRVERAKKYLSHGNESVIEIAYKTGYENVAYFNRMFKRYSGISPTEYRKTLRKSQENHSDK